jgi:hypothetical protein
MDITPGDIEQIKARNARVEIDKAWETSKTRRVFIAAVTYCLAAFYMHIAGLGNPFVGACVPTGGYLLSTLSLPYVRRIWAARVYKGQ